MSRYFLVFCFLFMSCGQQNEKIVDKKVILDILVDLHLTDATILVNGVHAKSVQVRPEFYDSIIATHGLTPHIFRWNIAYYTYTNELDNIMGAVIDTLNRIEGDLQKDMIDLKDSHANRSTAP